MSENRGAWPGHLSISATEATKAVEAIQFLWSLDTGTGTVAPSTSSGASSTSSGGNFVFLLNCSNSQ